MSWKYILKCAKDMYLKQDDCFWRKSHRTHYVFRQQIRTDATPQRTISNGFGYTHRAFRVTGRKYRTTLTTRPESWILIVNIINSLSVLKSDIRHLLPNATRMGFPLRSFSHHGDTYDKLFVFVVSIAFYFCGRSVFLFTSTKLLDNIRHSWCFSNLNTYLKKTTFVIKFT